MIGPMMENGAFKIDEKIGMVVSTSTTATTLATYIEAIRPQTKSDCSMNSMGPGCSPHIISPPIITAAVADPGMPNASMGSRADTPAEWSAASGATTPSGSPLPKRSGWREKRRAIPYDMKDAAVGPPGVIPIQQPIKVDRSSTTA